MKAKRTSLDRISNLPSTIIENILCLVPIKDAVRTSILSKNWRYNWAKIPKLVFSEYNMFDESTDDHQLSPLEQRNERKQLSRKCKFFYAIHQVLLLHDGPILKFTLLMRGADVTCVEIGQILLHLSRKSTVKKLKLDIWHSYQYNLPSSIFALHQLTDLHLEQCEAYFEPTFSGFSSLTSLSLIHVKTDDTTLLHLLSSCPLLKHFSLILDEEMYPSYGLNVIDLFQSLPVLEHLSIYYWTVLCLDQDTDLRELPTALVHLKSICICEMMSLDRYQLNFLSLLMRSSPSLEKIKIEMAPDRFEEFEIDLVTLEDYSDIWLENLQELEIENFINLNIELEFLKLILAKSHVLKKVSIVLNINVTYDEEFQMLRTLLRSHVHHH